MKIRMFALPNGQVQILVDETSFEEAQQMTTLLLTQLQAQGMPLELLGQIEQHKAEVSHVHVRQEVKQVP
jgi:hypothetical protein